MRTPWQKKLIERLDGTRGSDGGWGYTARTFFAAEPTAWTCCALWAHKETEQHWRSGIDRLARSQRSDGGIPVCAKLDSPCWTTAPAVLSWLRTSTTDNRYRVHAELGIEWLLKSWGKPIAPGGTVLGHDTTKIGWSWVEGTHSWIEPTAYALLALSAADRNDDPRVREGRSLILDRAIPGGGWNYGNARVLGNTLRPFPGTTGVALLALSGTTPTTPIEEGLGYLLAELPRVRAPMSLAWGLMALTAWDRRPQEAEDWLEETADRTLAADPNALYDSLLLLADCVPCPLIGAGRTAETVHG